MVPAIGHLFIPLIQQGNATARKARRPGSRAEDQRANRPGEPAPLPPRCAFAGEGTLLLHCIRVLADRGMPLAGVVSADPQVQAFALATDLPVYPSPDDWAATLPGAPVDYLFSIGNHPAIDSDALGHLRGGVIRYHDGPVPGSDGLPGPARAILRGEKKYAITWQLSGPRGDAGSALLQPVDIAPDDTALTLHAKCYEAAQAGFTRLVDQMRTGKHQPVLPQWVVLTGPQPHSTAPERPAGGSILSWHQPAEALSRLYRALDFGPYANPVSLPKILDGADLLVPVGLQLLDAPSRLAPGTVVELEAAHIRIATATRDVRISHVTTPEGVSLSPAQLRATRGWRPGYRLPEPPAGYVAAVEAREAVVAPHQAYWAAKLEKAQPTALPFAARLPLVQGRTAPHAVVQDWPADAQGHPLPAGEAGIPAALVAALLAYLHRATGTTGVCVGFAQRIPAEPAPAEPAFFAPLVPLEAHVETNAPFAAVRTAVARELNLAGTHQTYCRDLVARIPALRCRPELAAPLTYPVAVCLADTLEALPKTSPAVLTLVVCPGASRYALLADPARLDAAALHRLAAGLDTLLAHALQEALTPVGKLNLLPAAERHQILYAWNQTEHPYDRSACMHERFEAQVRRTPDAPAVLFGDQVLSYAALNRKANALAGRLQRAGVGPDVLVGICTEKSLEMVIGVLGIQKAGGAYVPLDPAYPKDRLNIVLDDLQLSVLVTQPHLADRFAGCPFQVVALDAKAEDDGTDENPASGVTADHLAYIIYTSGSTGIPKGVVVKHRPAINLIEWVNRTFAVGPGDRVLFVNSLGFDLSVYDIFGLLAAGGSVRVASGEELRDPRRLLEILYREPITFWNSAPATLSQLVPFGDAVPAGGKSHLRLAFLSGDWIPLPMPAWIRAAFPGTQVVSLGGATEATVWSNFYPVGALDEQWVSVPYGKPIQNARYHVLDAHLQPVPVGVAGDLYIGGECLAEGYHKRPELNAQKFIADPYGRPGDRLYRTGDLARYWADGNLEFLGRVDHQVKVRGYRIELGEIEAVLSTREDIQEVLVVAGPDPAGGKRLIAYVVAKAGCTPTTADLRAYLKDKLPEYMVPAAFVWLPAFPLNASGKIDRKALPEPLAAQARSDTYLAPRNPFETLLAQIWQEALQLEKVGVMDNFFEIGGHSLLAGRVISLIQQITGRLLPLSALFANPTVAQLAVLLKEDSLLDQVWDTLVPIRKAGTRPPLYCIHPVSGDVEYAYKLVPYLPADQPVYGILARGINGVDEPYGTVAEAAAAYVAQIEARQPEGPLHLAGYSYGGLVAYEMARLLAARGRKVESVTLFDTYPPNEKYRYKHYGLQYVVLSFLCLLTSPGNLRDFFRNQYWRSLQRRAKSAVKRAACRAGVYTFPANPCGSALQNDTALRDQIRLRLFRVLAKAVEQYRLQPYSGKLVFIRAMEGPARYLSQSDFGWRKNVSGPVAVHNVPGIDHDRIFAEDRHVRAVAGAMNLHLGGPPLPREAVAERC